MHIDKRIGLTSRLSRYVLSQSEPPLPAQRKLIEATAALGDIAQMQVPHEQAVLLTFLAQSIDARVIVEVGTFTGYSTLALAKGLAHGGIVYTHDISDEWSDIATEAWTSAGVSQFIQPHFGPATVTLLDLPRDQEVDLAFIDADKTGYIRYWELLIPLIRPGGLILADNALYGGAVAEDAPTGNALAIKQFNEHVRKDHRVESMLLTIADGLIIARKRDSL
ncbi:O-methyltransferase [Nocardia gamkensis]|uniref:O-methyltransferase n=1 Tax=Nocardia gamkensis TaxID=352869 RepID=UPI0036E18310